jgi:hypothetical protein
VLSRQLNTLTHLCIEGPTGGVQSTAQVVGRGLLPEPWPEAVHHLFAMKAVARCKSEQFHHGSCFLETPLAIFYGSGIHRNPEATEQPDPHHLCPIIHG